MSASKRPRLMLTSAQRGGFHYANIQCDAIARASRAKHASPWCRVSCPAITSQTFAADGQCLITYPPEGNERRNKTTDERHRQLQDRQRLQEDGLLGEYQLRVGDGNPLEALDVDVAPLQGLSHTHNSRLRKGGRVTRNQLDVRDR